MALTSLPTAGRRRLAAVLAAATLGVGLLVGVAPVHPAAAAPGSGTGTHGQTLTVSEVDDLDPAGTTVTVTGEGYDIDGFDMATEGMYLGFCVDNGPTTPPGPCVGGVDMEGDGGAARWVTNNPYPGSPAVAIAADGSFETTLTVQAADENVDCLALPAGKECKVTTRIDHRSGGDRSQDVKVPVTFGDGAPEPEGASITVEPRTGIDPAGQDLTVSGTGYPLDGPGLYVVYGPEPEGNSDASPFGAQAFVPAAMLGDDGAFTVTLPGVTAEYVDANGDPHDYRDGGGFVSTMRAHGVPDPAGKWATSVPVTFAGAARASTSTSLVSPPTAATVGRAVTVTASVTTDDAAAGASRAPVAGGTVEFLDGPTPIASTTLGSNGRATTNVTFTTAGSRALSARFLGTEVAAPSASTTATVVVAPAEEPPPPPPPPPSDTEPGGTRTGTGVNGQTLTATPVDNLDPAGTEVDIVGKGFTGAAGFDIPTDGLYVSVCVDRGPGVQPTPCMGGVDMEGGSGSTTWVTNNPYDGVTSGVAPVADDGSFSTRITVSARDEFIDCLDLPAGQRCVIVSRMDHRATGDRSQDVKVPICWAGEAECATDPIDPAGDGSVEETFTGFPVAGGTSVGPVGTGGGIGSVGRSSGPLAATGFDGRTLIPTGLVVLGAGAALVVVARRWTQRPRPATLPVRVSGRRP